jgi:hypothetical protein
MLNSSFSTFFACMLQDLSDFFVDVDMQGCIPPVGVISYVFPYILVGTSNICY